MNEDFKIELIALLSKALPQLQGKIQHGAVDKGTQAPYSVFTTPEEEPIRTIHGIVGYRTTFELSVFDDKLSDLEPLKQMVVKTLDSQMITNRRVYYVGGESGFYFEENIHAYSLTFKII